MTDSSRNVIVPYSQMRKGIWMNYIIKANMTSKPKSQFIKWCEARYMKGVTTDSLTDDEIQALGFLSDDNIIRANDAYKIKKSIQNISIVPLNTASELQSQKNDIITDDDDEISTFSTQVDDISNIVDSDIKQESESPITSNVQPEVSEMNDTKYAYTTESELLKIIKQQTEQIAQYQRQNEQLQLQLNDLTKMILSISEKISMSSHSDLSQINPRSNFD